MEFESDFSFFISRCRDCSVAQKAAGKENGSKFSLVEEVERKKINFLSHLSFFSCIFPTMLSSLMTPSECLLRIHPRVSG